MTRATASDRLDDVHATVTWNDVAELATAAEALYVAMRRVRQAPDDAKESLSVAQMVLVEPLLEHDELPVGQLASKADISVPSATQALKTLEARGLVERRRSSLDDRKILVRLSRSGLEEAAERRDRLRHRQITRLAQLTPAQRSAMAAELRKLTDLISAPDDGTSEPTPGAV